MGNRSLGPTGCVRFVPEHEGWDIIEIVTDIFKKEPTR